MIAMYYGAVPIYSIPCKNPFDTQHRNCVRLCHRMFAIGGPGNRHAHLLLIFIIVCCSVRRETLSSAEYIHCNNVLSKIAQV